MKHKYYIKIVNGKLQSSYIHENQEIIFATPLKGQGIKLLIPSSDQYELYFLGADGKIHLRSLSLKENRQLCKDVIYDTETLQLTQEEVDEKNISVMDIPLSHFIYYIRSVSATGKLRIMTQFTSGDHQEFHGDTFKSNESAYFASKNVSYYAENYKLYRKQNDIVEEIDTKKTKHMIITIDAQDSADLNSENITANYKKETRQDNLQQQVKLLTTNPAEYSEPKIYPEANSINAVYVYVNAIGKLTLKYRMNLSERDKLNIPTGNFLQANINGQTTIFKLDQNGNILQITENKTTILDGKQDHPILELAEKAKYDPSIFKIIEPELVEEPTTPKTSDINLHLETEDYEQPFPEFSTQTYTVNIEEDQTTSIKTTQFVDNFFKPSISKWTSKTSPEAIKIFKNQLIDTLQSLESQIPATEKDQKLYANKILRALGKIKFKDKGAYFIDNIDFIDNVDKKNGATISKTIIDCITSLFLAFVHNDYSIWDNYLKSDPSLIIQDTKKFQNFLNAKPNEEEVAQGINNLKNAIISVSVNMSEQSSSMVNNS